MEKILSVRDIEFSTITIEFDIFCHFYRIQVLLQLIDLPQNVFHMNKDF